MSSFMQGGEGEGEAGMEVVGIGWRVVTTHGPHPFATSPQSQPAAATRSANMWITNRLIREGRARHC
jgi:hypothetical protein